MLFFSHRSPKRQLPAGLTVAVAATAGVAVASQAQSALKLHRARIVSFCTVSTAAVAVLLSQRFVFPKGATLALLQGTPFAVSVRPPPAARIGLLLLLLLSWLLS